MLLRKDWHIWTKFGDPTPSYGTQHWRNRKWIDRHTSCLVPNSQLLSIAHFSMHWCPIAQCSVIHVSRTSEEVHFFMIILLNLFSSFHLSRGLSTTKLNYCEDCLFFLKLWTMGQQIYPSFWSSVRICMWSFVQIPRFFSKLSFFRNLQVLGKITDWKYS